MHDTYFIQDLHLFLRYHVAMERLVVYTSLELNMMHAHIKRLLYKVPKKKTFA